MCLSFRIIRWIHRGKVAYEPKLFTNLKLIDCVKFHPTQYDESDEIEEHKKRECKQTSKFK